MDRLQRAELIADVAREAASSNDLQAILDRVMARLAEAIRFRGGSIAFPAGDGMLGIAVAAGSIDDAARAVRIEPGQGIVGTVFATGRAFRTGDLDRETRVRPLARTVGTNRLMRSYLCVPLSSGGEVFGVLQIDSVEADAFDEDDQELLETVGGVLGGLVRLARLVDRERAALASRDDFFATVTHDLRSPLTVIRGQAQRLLRRHPADGDTPILSAILTQERRLERLIASLLDVAHAQSGDPLPAMRSSAELASVVERAARETLGPDRATRLVFDLRPVEGEFDIRRVEQIVTNLVENAYKYARAGAIEIRTREEGDEAVIAVWDHGPGVADDQRERIFRRWDRGGRTDGRGSGLGLYIVWLAAQAHDGSVTATSRDDGEDGAVFVVRLRRAARGSLAATPTEVSG